MSWRRSILLLDSVTQPGHHAILVSTSHEDDLASKHHEDVCDVAIVGASFAGLALARALSVASQGALRVFLIDGRAQDTAAAHAPDARAFALSAATRYLFEHLSVWPGVADKAQPVEKIEITDSSLEAGVRPVLLAWDNRLANGDPASYVVPAGAVLDALTSVVDADPAIDVVRGARVTGCALTDHARQLICEDGAVKTAKLVAAADGQKSPLRSEVGLSTVGKRYQQRGIVTTIRHNKPHNATAIQHFLPGGPFAMLPLRDHHSCITWSEDETEAERILALNTDAFSDELDQRLAGRLGAFNVVGARQSWPLSMHLARAYVADRFALVGDAAHGVHPIAGQGLNLGLRDVAALVDVVLDAARLGLDFGRVNVLQRYEQWRRSDSFANALAFDGLNSLFSNDTTLLRSLREVGLGTVNRLEGLKTIFVTEAAGQAGEVPAMMRKDVA